MIETIKRIDRPFWHKNFTVKKALYFGLTAVVGAIITLILTYAFTEWAGWWYMLSIMVASAIAIVVKFFITAIWVFK